MSGRGDRLVLVAAHIAGGLVAGAVTLVTADGHLHVDLPIADSDLADRAVDLAIAIVDAIEDEEITAEEKDSAP